MTTAIAPIYFAHTGEFTSDALLVRYDNPEADPVVITRSGAERPINHKPWPIAHCRLMVERGKASELSAAEAEALLASVLAGANIPKPNPGFDTWLAFTIRTRAAATPRWSK